MSENLRIVTGIIIKEKKYLVTQRALTKETFQKKDCFILDNLLKKNKFWKWKNE